MKLLNAFFGVLCICCNLNSMDRPQAPLGWLTELVDVPMAALLIPAAQNAPADQDSLAISPNSTPGMLQTLHDTINQRSARTK